MGLWDLSLGFGVFAIMFNGLSLEIFAVASNAEGGPENPKP